MRERKEKVEELVQARKKEHERPKKIRRKTKNKQTKEEEEAQEERKQEKNGPVIVILTLSIPSTSRFEKAARVLTVFVTEPGNKWGHVLWL